MKKIAILILSSLLCGSMSTFAQAPAQGTISYDITIQLRKQVAKKNPMMAALVPETSIVKMDVIFKEDVFALVTKPNNSKQGDVQMSVNTDGKQIINLKTKMIIEQNVFNNKKYYSESSVAPSNDIKYAAETRNILGYTCNKAIVTDSDKKVYTVWYTTAIRFPYNPEGETFLGLKGAVLAFESDETTGIATIINKQFSGSAITPDAGAKKISKDQMTDLEDEMEANTSSVKYDTIQTKK